MSTAHERRILLVEDERPHYELIRQRLAAEAYHVTLATTYWEAKRLLETEHFHLAILDICLTLPCGEEGLRLLEDVERLGLRGIMPCIMVSSYATNERILLSLDEAEAQGFVCKLPRYLDALLAKVTKVFGDLKLNFDIEYAGRSLEHLEAGAQFIRGADGQDWLAPELLNWQMRDLMSGLFNRAKQLVVKPMARGLSGSAIFEVNPNFQTGGLGQSVVVKVGRREKIATEKRNYEHHVEYHLPQNHATSLKHGESRHLGALIYTLAHTRADDTRGFAAFYRRRSAAEVVAALKHLFGDTCALWYRNATALQFENLRDLYLQAFDLHEQPARLAKEIAAMRPDLDPAAPTLAFTAPAVVLPNPLRWLADDQASVLAARRCVTHGDLHADNLLINGAGQCWLIDFYRTYESHTLRDFVVLETDIKFRLAKALTLKDFCALEHALTHMADAAAGIRLGPEISAEAHKAAQVIAGLRAEAWVQLGWRGGPAARDMLCEHLISLLMATLNILRLRHYKETPALRPQRERALLSAGLICERLERLGT